MGSRSSKSSLRNAMIYLNISADRVSASDEKFWNQILQEDVSIAREVISSIRTQEIRMLRDGSPRNFSLLAFKMVECLRLSTKMLCNTQSQQTAVLNATAILARLIPCIFEDELWRDFFSVNSIEPLVDDTNGNIKLSYPEKGVNEKDYSAYLPDMGNHRAVSIDTRNESSFMMDNVNTKVAELLIGDDRSEPASFVDLEQESDGAKKLDKQSSGLDSSELLQSISSNSLARKLATKQKNKPSLMRCMLISICDLLFCPEFTVLSHGDDYLSNAVDAPPEDLKSLTTYDYVWEPGVGFDSSANSTTMFDKNRAELLKTLLVSLSGVLYETPARCNRVRNEWMEVFVSSENRHALPLFTSLLNVVFVYEPSRPYIKFASTCSGENGRESLVELAVHILLAALDYQNDNYNNNEPESGGNGLNKGQKYEQASSARDNNLFLDYMSRIHRDEDYNFMIQGFTRLLNYRLVQRYLWAPHRAIDLDLELMLLFWKICNLNRNFMLFALKSNHTLDIVLPILYHLNENFQDPSRTALIHLGVFNLLILSGERNFGVRLNKHYSGSALTNLPEFSGSHADLMIVVFHKLIMYGHKINQLYDYLLNILANISPYLKGLTNLASKCLIHLFETFSSSFVVLTEPNYHQLVLFLLEIFNNIIQYQFDSNANLIHVIISKRELFTRLANMPSSQQAIDAVLRRLARRKLKARQMESLAHEQRLDEADLEASAGDGRASSDERACNEGQSIYDQFDFDLATVSCETCQHSSSRRVVSLVATPDINHFTQPTHPFLGHDHESHWSDESSGSKQQAASISFDDILNESADLNEILCAKESQNDETNSERSSETEIQVGSSSSSSKQPPADSGNETSCKKWRPTSEWLVEWKRSLPMQTILRMIAVLVPQLQPLESGEIIKFLQNGTLVGLLPVPHPILIRKYRTNNDSTIWFRACTWAIIYVKSTAWTNTDIRLIRIL